MSVIIENKQSDILKKQIFPSHEVMLDLKNLKKVYPTQRVTMWFWKI
ncbi:hypothetical protein JCM19274_5142 [Algibacter lectus]|uniref:Uncharacterized protein n=1 Tax=Algibacter lectus TaxID=221126 RepID=A0A090WPW9_9FLAO|nr:hypothetical protein JCM19274_5142 [Algibacter lectus]